MKTYKDFIVTESTKSYAASLRKIALDKQLKSISKKDKETLSKIADLLAKANEATSYVADFGALVSALTKDIRDLLILALKKGNMEIVNQLASTVGKTITTKGQQKGKGFMFPNKKGMKKI